MKDISDKSVDLMITSPPYPMIQMWDEIFAKQNPKIYGALKNEDGKLAFELMHQELDKVWTEVYRVLKNGGIACINIGDATRTINERFQIFTNHSRILKHCLDLGFHALPEILWVKSTNKPDKFMGSGMLPVGAYVTLEHEHILILRKDDKRKFIRQDDKLNRQKSAFFWEERNKWFLDRWDNLNGVLQKLNDGEARERSAAYPFELVYRLINMFSVQGDVVLDPFLGTGTTSFGAIVSGRGSIGYEIDETFKEIIFRRITDSLNMANRYNETRLQNHKDFINQRVKEKGEQKYTNETYNFPVVTRQEIKIKLPVLQSLKQIDKNLFEAEHN